MTLDLSAGEHKSEEFVKINPRSCVPTIVDDDFVLWESKAILMYLPNKMGMCKTRTYPKCPKMRALVHQRLFYDAVDFYPRVTDVTNLAYSPMPIVTAQHKAGLVKALNVMEESFLEGHDYFVGDHVTIADFAFCSSIATLMAVGFNMDDFPRILAWFERMKGLKGFDQLEAGARQYGDFVKSRLKNSLDDF